LSQKLTEKGDFFGLKNDNHGRKKGNPLFEVTNLDLNYSEEMVRNTSGENCMKSMMLDV